MFRVVGGFLDMGVWFWTSRMNGLSKWRNGKVEGLCWVVRNVVMRRGCWFGVCVRTQRIEDVYIYAVGTYGLYICTFYTYASSRMSVL